MTASTMSGDGNKLAIVVAGQNLFISANGGSTWILSSGLPPAGFTISKPTFSYDGSMMAVLALNGSNSNLYISTDGGGELHGADGARHERPGELE